LPLTAVCCCCCFGFSLYHVVVVPLYFCRSADVAGLRQPPFPQHRAARTHTHTHTSSPTRCDSVLRCSFVGFCIAPSCLSSRPLHVTVFAYHIIPSQVTSFIPVFFAPLRLAIRFAFALDSATTTFPVPPPLSTLHPAHAQPRHCIHTPTADYLTN